MEKTDIYLSKGVMTQFTYHSGDSTTDIELWHEPCGYPVFEACSSEEKNAWAFMEAMAQHNRECPAGRPKKPEGLFISESEIRRE